MKYSDFCKRLIKLEAESSRLNITDQLVQLIGDLGEDEVREAIYLMLGRLGPRFDNVEFNMAEKMVARAIAGRTGNSIEKVWVDYKRIGDLGEVVVNALGKVTIEKEISVREAYECLRRLAVDGGQGSQDRKITALVALYRCMDGSGIKLTTRMVLGKLRLGFSEKTIIDVLSVIIKGDKSAARSLEEMFQICPDIGLLTKKVLLKGIEKAKKEIKVTVGVPVDPALCQRLNSPKEIIEKMGVVGVEQKFDGTRVQIHFDRGSNTIKAFTRNLEDSTNMFPELLELAKYFSGDSVIFDSEAIGINAQTGKTLPFQETIKRKRKHEIKKYSVELPLRFYIFDVLYLNGDELLRLPYVKRRKLLEMVITKNDIFVVNNKYIVDDWRELKRLHESFLSEGYEGAVIKQGGGAYLPGRQGWNWVKIKEAEGTTGKLLDTLDLVIMGYYRGKGKRSRFGLGSFLVGLVDGERLLTIAKVGTGVSDELFNKLNSVLEKLATKDKPVNYYVNDNLSPDVWVVPKIVVEVAADEITKSPIHTAGWALRFPRLVRIRDDKDVTQATSLDEAKLIGRIG